MKYHTGEVLLMAPLPKHGRDASLIADNIKVLLDHQGCEYDAFTPVTMELPQESGIDPDYCFYIDHWQAISGKERIDWRNDPPPDLVLEIDVTSYSDVQDYLPYRVPEVWLFRNKELVMYVAGVGVCRANFQSIFSRCQPCGDHNPMCTSGLRAQYEYGDSGTETTPGLSTRK
jgi:Uma2 family endonuclease